jgi:hypothetical protein
MAVDQPSASRNPLTNRGGPHRREFLRLGLAGFGALTWADLLRRRAAAATAPSKDTALLVVWLHGGASHLETYDPKPAAPAEYRGPYGAIPTNVTGMHLSELLPGHAKLARRFTLLRSLAHTGPCHDSGPQQLFTGFPITVNRLKPEHPDLFAVVDRLRADPSRPLPNNVGVPPIPYLGAGYLGPAHEPFAVHGDPNDPRFEVPNVGLKDDGQRTRLGGRVRLRQQLDDLGRRADDAAGRGAFDAFQGQAWNVLTGPQARRAFDLALEPERVRDRYGRNTWGQRCLLARRLVEAGVDLVTATLNGPLCGRVGNWDDHAVNRHQPRAGQVLGDSTDGLVEGPREVDGEGVHPGLLLAPVDQQGPPVGPDQREGLVVPPVVFHGEYHEPQVGGGQGFLLDFPQERFVEDVGRVTLEVQSQLQTRPLPAQDQRQRGPERERASQRNEDALRVVRGKGNGQDD